MSSDLPTEETETKGGKLSVHTSQGRTRTKGHGLGVTEQSGLGHSGSVPAGAPTLDIWTSYPASQLSYEMAFTAVPLTG